MIRHIVAWDFKEGLSEKEKNEYAKKIKFSLENLKSIISGIAELEVKTDLLPASTKNIMLYSLFESQEALDSYQKHPEHLKAGELIGSVCKNRICVDFEE